MSTEVLLFVEFKIESLDMFNDMTMLDFHTYVAMMERQMEKRNKRFSNMKQLASQLHALKVILNTMEV